MNPAEIIRTLGMRPHPEGGHFVETWRDAPEQGGRGAGTAMEFALALVRELVGPEKQAELEQAMVV